MALTFERLNVKFHNRSTFFSGNSELDNFLKTQARQQMDKKLSVCFVMFDGESEILGFYTLTSATLQIDENLREDTVFKSKYQNIPVALLGRFAIDIKYQNLGLGGVLLSNCIKRVKFISDNHIGISGIFVEPKNIELNSFYEKYGFIQVKKGMFYSLKNKKPQDGLEVF